MRIARVSKDEEIGLGLESRGGVRVLFDPTIPDLDGLVRAGSDALQQAADACLTGPWLSLQEVVFLPPLMRASKIVCVGLNHRDHSAEAGFETPDFPTFFGRFNSSLIGHDAPMVKPALSDELDYEGEMVAVIGRGGKAIREKDACDHVIAYSIFNDGSLRDYQMKTPQWTAGKKFDGTGAFGPWLVTTDELPTGAKGLKLETRINGVAAQQASTSDMVFDIATLISTLSSIMTLEAGDVIVSGTPASVGMGKTPPKYLNIGDICEVEIEGIGLLRNRVGSS